MERQRISSGSPFESTVGYSRAVRSGPFIAVSGTAPIWPADFVDPDPLTQARRCWEIALKGLAQLGGRPDDVIRTRMYVVDRRYEPMASQAHQEVFGDIRPATSMIVVAGLLDERWLMEFEIDAVVSR